MSKVRNDAGKWNPAISNEHKDTIRMLVLQFVFGNESIKSGIKACGTGSFRPWVVSARVVSPMVVSPVGCFVPAECRNPDVVSPIVL